MSEAKASTALVRVDPQMLLASAVEKGASVETLERLVDLAKVVKAEQARSQWYEAISEFQGNCPEIKKKSEASILTAKGSYRYKYAELPEIMATVRPILQSLGLSVFWRTKDEPGKISANCFVAHVAGHVEESGWVSMPLPSDQERGGGNPLQRAGSALSYARRYSLMAILGIAPEDDDDAQSAGSRPRESAKATEAPPPDGHAIAMQEWLTELARAESEEALRKLWGTLTVKQTWQQFSEAEREQFIVAKDQRMHQFKPKA